MTDRGRTDLSEGAAALRAEAEQHGQGHLFRFWDELAADSRARLLQDVAAIDFNLFERVWADTRTEAAVDLDHAAAPTAVPYPASDDCGVDPAAGGSIQAEGERLIGEGKVAAVTVAGGQATRLGFDRPKGTFPIGPVSGKSLFAIFAEGILGVCRRSGGRVPWYVMTSASNHAQTRAFFSDHDFFGLNPHDVRFFEQGVMPIADLDGRILLEAPDRVSFAPNGHGGSLAALVDSGILAELAERGIEQISYFQVDNPLVYPVDPTVTGLHAAHASQVTSLAVPKAFDEEKVGHFVCLDGKLGVVEYTFMPDRLIRARNESGGRLYDLANIAVHVFDRAYVEELAGRGGGVDLPWHRAVKKVSFIDPDRGTRVEPQAPNAVKLEMFVFDSLAAAERTLLVQTERWRHFSPVKNATGVDSPESARRDIIRRSARWLERHGVVVPRDSRGEPDCQVEVGMRLMWADERAVGRRLGSVSIAPGDRLYLDLDDA